MTTVLIADITFTDLEPRNTTAAILARLSETTGSTEVSNLTSADATTNQPTGNYHSTH